MSNKKTNIKGLLFLLCILALNSCNVTKYLNDGQYIVKKNKIVIDDKENSKDEAELIYNLESFVIQKPNTRFVGTPRELIYFRNKEEFEKPGRKKGRIKEARLPVIHDDALMQETATRMEKYLRNSKGFYFAKVIPSASLSQHKAEISYTVITDNRYTVRSKEYFVEDPELKRLIDKYESSTLIYPGSKIDESIFENEKTRLYTKLQDKGYANFAKNFIEFKADSSNMQMDIFIRVLPPPKGEIHQKYNIGKIHVYPNYRGTIDDNSPFKEVYDGVTYEFTSENPFVTAEAIGRVIQIKEGDQYKKRHVDGTYSSLAKLGTFRFINIKSQINPLDSTKIDYNIFLTPIENKWAWEGSLNLFYTFLPQVGNVSRLGLSGNTSLTNTNTFGGAEKLILSIESTGEITLDQTLNRNITLTPQLSLQYPRLRDNTGIINRLLKLKLPLLNRTPDKIFDIYDNSITTYNVSYSYIQQINQYITNSINGSASYEYRYNNKFTYIITPFNINSLSPRVDPEFKELILDPSPLLARSFEKRLITTFGIPQLIYQMNSPVFSSGFNWNLRVNTEVSGLEILGLNGIYNSISSSNSVWAIPFGEDDQFEFSRFALIDADMNATQRFLGKYSIAGRFRLGLASPFLNNDVIPFIKQFYVGGANSIRGWQTRELGPGGFNQTNVSNGAFFQSGDIVMEGSIEARFPLFWDFEGAVFIDAGNVWTIREDIDRPGSQFTFGNFYNQIAVGAGFGVRWDLDFILIRLDMGYKVRNNYDDFIFGYLALPEPNFTSIWEYTTSPNYLIGLAYPF